MRSTAAHEPIVSIIIPCFNAERYVKDAIESALAQTYCRKEVIVVDDGSTDGSLSAIRSFGKAVRWISGPNRGGSAARNRGVALSRGELVQFLDADDLLHAQKIAHSIPLLLADRGIAVCSEVEIRDDFTDTLLRRVALARGNDFRCCCFDNIPTPAPLHWKQSIEHVGGFDETLACAQEFDLHLRLVCAGIRFHLLPEVLVTVRRRPHSVSSDYVTVLSSIAHAVESATGVLRAHGRDGEAELRSLSEVLSLAAMRLLERDRPELAHRYRAIAKSIHRSAGTGALGSVRRLKYAALDVKWLWPALRAWASVRRRTRRSQLRRLDGAHLLSP